MDSFPVICETCRARLRVRDPGIIGEIHACPKCGSMVYIVPPADWSPGEGEAPSAEAAEAVAEPMSTPAPPPATTVHDVSVAADVPELDTLLGQMAAAPSEPLPAATEPPAPVAAPATSLVSRWVWWTAGGAGLLVVGGLLMAVWTSGGADSVAALPPVATEPAAAVAPTAAPSERSEDASVRNADETVDIPASRVAEAARPEQRSEDASVPIAGETVDVPGSGVAEVAPAGEKRSEDASVRSAGETVDVPASGVAEVAPAEKRSEDASAAPAPSSVVKFDPLDFDPTHLNLSASGVAEVVTPTEEEQSEDASGSLGEVATEAGAVGEAETASLGTTAAVELGPSSSDALRRRDVAAQLSLKLGAIDLPQVPLARVLEMVADMADVPVTLEPGALEMSGISPRFQVTLSGEDLTTADLLSAVLAQCHLVYEARDGQIIVVKPDVDERRSVNYRVDDLVAAGVTDATQVAEMIKRFVAPETWQSAGGTGTITVDGDTLRVDQTERVLYQILTFCERLRLARGLATRSRYPVDRLRIEPVYPQIDARLSAQTTFTFLPWSRLADVLRHWEDSADVTVLVDWPALAQAGLAPSSPVACAVADRAWSDALDAVLAPLGLAWWPVDAETIQITTREAAERTRQIEFYPVPKNLLNQYASPDALVAALADEAKTQAMGDAGGGATVEIELDQPSGRVVVLGPPAAQRYLSGRLAGE